MIADQIKQGNTDDAIIDLKEILLSNPDDLIALSMSGSAYMRAGDETKAFNFFEAAIKADPDSFSAHGDLAFVAGESFDVTFSDAGDYEFQCDPHAGAGMKGVIHVE